MRHGQSNAYHHTSTLEARGVKEIKKNNNIPNISTVNSSRNIL